jgi:thiol-disulfide isomerase/thioredoxin
VHWSKRALGRGLDALALAVIAFIGWKLLLAPRALNLSNARPAPRIAYQRLRGGTFRLSSVRGRVVFLDFYASWCEPCRLELPLIEAYARAHPTVDVVPIDVGEPRATAALFAKRMHLRDVVLDPTASARAFFAIQGFPSIVVIDPQGRIRATWAGFNPAIEMAMANAQQRLQ